MAFYPELVAEFGVADVVEDFGFACVGDDGVVVWGGDRPRRLLDFAGEEVWDGLLG